MRNTRTQKAGSALTIALLFAFSIFLSACDSNDSNETASFDDNPQEGQQEPNATCRLIENGFGPDGTSAIDVQTFVSGLDVPWGMAFLPDGSLLLTERNGHVRLVRGGELVGESLIEVDVRSGGEGGLLGLTLHPDFTNNRFFYLYATVNTDNGPRNRVNRYQLDPSFTAATFDRTIIDNLPAAGVHNGGRIQIGPDGFLYIATGDARDPSLAQRPDSLAGKILRISIDGDIPPDNPISNSPVFISGIRNVQAFDWVDERTMIIADHGPSGDLGRSGHDEISIARAGDNLGWPNTWRCERQEGIVTPELVWQSALPPGGGIIYRGTAIPEWTGNFIMGGLGSETLHQIVLTTTAERATASDLFVYLRNQYGRLRTVIEGPDGYLYVATSNCDGRGSCPSGRDSILRIGPATTAPSN